MASLPRGLVARFARLTSHSSDSAIDREQEEEAAAALCRQETETPAQAEQTAVAHSRGELERIRGPQGTLRDRLEKLAELKRATKHGAFEAPHIRAFNLISFVEEAQAKDPLVCPERVHNPFIILKPQDASSHVSKTIDKEMASARSAVERSKVLCVAPWTGRQQLSDGVFQLWRTLLDSQPTKEVRRYISEEYSHLAIAQMRATATAFFKLGYDLSSPRNLLTATQLVNPTPNMAIDQQDLVLLWKEPKFKAAFRELHQNRPERMSYILDAMSRVTGSDYTPLTNDKMVLYNLSTAIFDHFCSSSDRKMHFVSISRMSAHPPRLFPMFSSAEMVLYFVSLANDLSTLQPALDDFTEVLNCDYFRKVPIIVVFTDVLKFKEVTATRDLGVHFPEYTGACNCEQALQFVTNLFGRVKSSHSAKVITHSAEKLTKKSITFFGKTLRDCSMDATAVEGAMKPLVGL